MCGSRSAHTGGRITAVTATLGVSRQTVKKANNKTVSALEMSTLRVCRCVRGWRRAVSQPARSPLGGQAGACGSEMTLILDE